MKKTLLTVFTVLSMAAINAVNAQIEFYHSFGGGLYSAGEAGAGWAVMYAPRLNVAEVGNDMILSVGTNIGLGFSGNSTYNSRTGSEGSSSLLLDLPLLAELNFGHGATDASRSDFGGFVGAGYGFNKMTATYDDPFGNAYSSNASSNGIVFSGGVKGLIKDNSICLRVSYMLNMKSGASNILGLGILYNLGM